MRRLIPEHFHGLNMVAAPPAGAGPTSEPAIALVVEDEEEIQKLIAIILGWRGYDVLCCGDGCTAAALFEEHAQFVKVVLLDKTVPNFNLLSFCEHIRARRPNLPIVVQTALFGPDEESHSVFAMGVAVVLKPYLPGELLQAVQVACELMEYNPSEAQ